MNPSAFAGAVFSPHALVSRIAAVGLAACFVPVSGHAQTSPSPVLQDAYFAWDEGDYVEAMEGYLDVLEGPDGQRYAEEVAELTGERHPVREVDDDGRNPAISPDGAYLAWEREVDGEGRTRVESLAGSGERQELRGTGVALLPEGVAAWAETDEGEGARLRIHDLEDGTEEVVELPDMEPLAVSGSPEPGEVYVTAGLEGEGDRLHIVRLAAPDWAPEVLELGDGHAAEPLPAAGGRFLAFSRPEASPLEAPEGEPTTPPGPEEVGVKDLETGEWTTHPGTGAAVSAGGEALAFQHGEDGENRILDLLLTPEAAAGTAGPTELMVTDDPVADVAPSPDGSEVAFRSRPHVRWEVFVAPVDGDGEVEQVTRDAQHDLFPAWLDGNRILAMKGEARHRRAHLHDRETGESYELFHNNTLRTIAPQYAWVAHPDGEGVAVNAERDGNTISPERGVYWVDLTETVGHEEVTERVRENLEAERALLEDARREYGPMEDEIRLATEAVSVPRIYHYAEALYGFGPKWAADEGNQKAIEYLAETLESWGYDAELQWFEAGGRAGGVRTANVVATLEGTENPERVYIISSHFDSVVDSPGADDNSSGTTALLEAARVLKDHPRRASIQFVFLTAEEAGLIGAREFVEFAEEDDLDVAGVLNNDMIGWTRSHRLDNTIRYSNDGIRDLQHSAANLFSDLITYDSRYYRGTDAAVFYDAYGDIVGGIGSYPVLHNPHYHQSTDELWTINQRLVAEVSRTTVATIMRLADGPGRLTGLRLDGEGDDELRFAWDPAPERGVEAYKVRVRTTNGDWRELEPVTEPQLTIPSGEDVEEVSVRARTADGLESYDEVRMSREDW